MSELGKLYQDVILEHHKAPRHAAALGAHTHRAEGNNPLCGDRVVLTLQISEGRVQDVGCEVKGCAICRASGSMLAEAIIGNELSRVVGLGERFLAELAGAPAPQAAGAVQSEPWGPLEALLEARRHPNRMRCATLPWEALERALRAPRGPFLPGEIAE
jgi:nitrogen fixation protein NifU and related proteins